jgi:hypothetical protein
MRAQIFARDGYRCQIPGCRSSRNLEAHHVIPQAKGGKATMSNGTTICGGHHAANHEGLLEITGPAPRIKVRWLVPPSQGEEEAMREALLERELDELLNGTMRVPRGTPMTSPKLAPTSDCSSPVAMNHSHREHRRDERR